MISFRSFTPLGGGGQPIWSALPPGSSIPPRLLLESGVGRASPSSRRSRGVVVFFPGSLGAPEEVSGGFQMCSPYGYPVARRALAG